MVFGIFFSVCLQGGLSCLNDLLFNNFFLLELDHKAV